MKFKNLVLLCTIYFVFIQYISGQENQDLVYIEGDENVSVIGLSTGSAKCSVVEYPEFLLLIDIPHIPIQLNAEDSENVNDNTPNRLIAFIDSIYLNKPIKYILNSHSHGHSLSTVMPFLDKGAKLVTAKENIEIYDKRELFGSKTSKGYSNSIIQISSDTILLAESTNPIEVLHLKKTDYKSIPTETFLFFSFPSQKLLATSCMVYLTDLNKEYGFKGTVYSDRLVDVSKIIEDKNLTVESTLQLHRTKIENDIEKPAIYPISHFDNVLEQGWHRMTLSEHFQNMSYKELTTKKDSLLHFLVVNDIYHVILNHAVYTLIEKKEYQKAVAIAQILILYEPDRFNEIDTLGEAYYNNGQLAMAKHYDTVIKDSEEKIDGLGWEAWVANQKDRLGTGS